MTTPDYSTTCHSTTEKSAFFDNSADGLVTHLRAPDSEHKIADGGLRVCGKYKTNSANKPLITVVTVVYNGAKFLEDTIKSVIDQTYDNLEYIVVDGGSTDGTLDIIRKYQHAIDYWVSEPDGGIYHAMNKGIDLGSGRWINFMNAGDYFFDSGVFSKVFKKPSQFDGVKVVYGDHEVRYSTKTKIVQSGKVENLWKGSQFCHQSSIVELAYHKNNKFNLCRKIAADFEFFYNANASGVPMIYLPFVISKVSSGGVSDVRRIDSILEMWTVVEKSLVINVRYSLLVIFESFKSVLKGIIKK